MSPAWICGAASSNQPFWVFSGETRFWNLLIRKGKGGKQGTVKVIEQQIQESLAS